MSVNTDTNKILMDCSTVTSFDFTFKIFKETDLVVSLVDNETQEITSTLALHTDYEVSISRIADGGTLTLTETHEGYSVYAVRTLEITQPEQIPTEGHFPEQTIENALDRNCMISQQLQEQIDRAIKVPGTSTFVGVDVSLPVPAAENVLAWNEDADELVNYDVKGEMADFQEQVNGTITEFEGEVNATIASATAAFTEQITEFETGVGEQITEFENQVNETIAEVEEAAEKINELEEAVQTAVEKAEVATQKAGEAATSATAAAEQATRAEELVDAMEEEYEDINAFVNSFPASTPMTTWLTDGDGTIQNIPLKSFEAYNTPFIKNAGSEHKKVKILGPIFAVIELQDTTKKCYLQKEDLTIDVESILDIGNSLTAGKDYYIYLCWDETNEVFKWQVSLNSTYPDGYDEYTSRKLGGFHAICRTVTSSNAPQANHPAIGYNAGDIIPNSVWAYNFKAETGNAGKAFIDKQSGWCYIYNNSGTGSTTGSVFGATRTHTRTYHDFVEDLFTKGDRMIEQDEFSKIMDMSNYKTAVLGAAQPNPDTTGGHVDTANKAMISKYFIEEGCGLQWQFTKHIHATGGSGWSVVDGISGAKGQQYGSAYVVVAGGAWNDGGYAGPRSRNCYAGSSAANATVGGRGLSCHVEF